MSPARRVPRAEDSGGVQGEQEGETAEALLEAQVRDRSGNDGRRGRCRPWRAESVDRQDRGYVVLSLRIRSALSAKLT